MNDVPPSVPSPPPPGPAAGPVGPTLNYALWADRVLAALIDGLFVLVTTIVFYAVAFAVLAGLGAAGGGVAQAGAQGTGGTMGLLSGAGCCLLFVLFPLVTFLIGLYNKVFLVSKRGSSIGQGAMKLEGTRPERRPTGQRHARRQAPGPDRDWTRSVFREPPGFAVAPLGPQAANAPRQGSGHRSY